MDNAKLVKIVKKNVLFVFPFLVNDLSMPKLEESTSESTFAGVMPGIHIFLENYLWKVLRNYLLILMRNRVFKLCFSKVFTSFLFCFVYDKQRFNIVGFFVSKYVFL